jgi:hypothetical protein
MHQTPQTATEKWTMAGAIAGCLIIAAARHARPTHRLLRLDELMTVAVN